MEKRCVEAGFAKDKGASRETMMTAKQCFPRQLCSANTFPRVLRACVSGILLLNVFQTIRALAAPATVKHHRCSGRYIQGGPRQPHCHETHARKNRDCTKTTHSEATHVLCLFCNTRLVWQWTRTENYPGTRRRACIKTVTANSY